MMKWLESEMRGLPMPNPSYWRKHSQEDRVWKRSGRIQRTRIAKIYVVDRHRKILECFGEIVVSDGYEARL